MSVVLGLYYVERAVDSRLRHTAQHITDQLQLHTICCNRRLPWNSDSVDSLDLVKVLVRGIIWRNRQRRKGGEGNRKGKLVVLRGGVVKESSQMQVPKSLARYHRSRAQASREHQGVNMSKTVRFLPHTEAALWYTACSKNPDRTRDPPCLVSVC